MVEFATQYEVDNFKEFELKLLTPLDALEFAKAQNESYHQLSNYFDQNYFSKPHSFIEIFNSLMLSIKSQEIELYGLYRDKKLLGVGVYHFLSYSEFGCEIVYWMRESESGKKIGAYFLKKLTLYAIYIKKYRFVQLQIDESNLASRAIATKIGYEHIESFVGNTEGRLGTGTYFRYLCFDGEIDALANEYKIRKVDLIDHPAYLGNFRYLILNEAVNEAFKWPYTVLERKKKEGEPERKRPRQKPYRQPIMSNSPIPRYRD